MKKPGSVNAEQNHRTACDPDEWRAESPHPFPHFSFFIVHFSF
jgi:hypothetical protein